MGGHGAAAVFAYDDTAILLERAAGGRTLADLVYAGKDNIATHHICSVTAQLHSKPTFNGPSLRRLENWFNDLLLVSANSEKWLTSCAAQARGLLQDQRGYVPLHGDLRHGNILNFGEGDWRAIDPKGLFGERTAEYAAFFLNPDLADEHRPFATVLHHFEERVSIASACAALEPIRLLRWIHAWSGLSALWFLEGGVEPRTQRQIASFAADALGQ